MDQTTQTGRGGEPWPESNRRHTFVRNSDHQPHGRAFVAGRRLVWLQTCRKTVKLNNRAFNQYIYLFDGVKPPPKWKKNETNLVKLKFGKNELFMVESDHEIDGAERRTVNKRRRVDALNKCTGDAG